MKKQTIKKALPMVLGALIVSVIPFNNFAEANREYFVSKNTIIERKLEANKAEINRVENTKYITLEEAQNIALKRVGDKTAKITEVKMDLNDKKPYYEIEITTNHKNGKMEMVKKFEIEINAITGKIVDVDVEVKKILNGKVIVDKDKDKDNNDKDKIIPMEKIYITQEKAIEITKNKIGNNVTLEEIELDDDDKVPVYEIEMYDEEYEYELEIHAITGEILKFEKERD